MKKLIAILSLFTTLSFAQVNGVSWYTAVIDSGETLSAELDLRGRNLKMISIAVDTANWTSANLTLYAYNPYTEVYDVVQDEDSTAYTITIGNISAPKRITLTPIQMAGLERVKFLSSAAQDVGDVTIYIQCRPY